MLVKASGAVGVPGVQLTGHSQMDKPVHLQRLMEGLGLMGGHYVAVFRDFQKVGLPLGVGLRLGHFPGKGGIPLTQHDDGFAGGVHGFQLFPAAQGVGVVEHIQRFHGLVDVLLVLPEAFQIDFLGADSVAGAALFHEFGENAALIGGFPLVGHVVQNLPADGALFPEGDDLFFLNLQILLGHGKVNQFPVVHDVHIFQGVAAQLREGGGGLGAVSLFAHNQLAAADGDFFMGEIVEQGQGAELRNETVPSYFS